MPQQGEVVWIGLRPERRASMLSVSEVLVSPEIGIEGDRYRGRTGHRQMTLIQAEHLPVIASIMLCENIEPELLRRNLVVSGINLLALRDRVITVGDVKIEITGLCHPCSRMEETLGEGGYNAVRGHGGVTARVLSPGRIAVGDQVFLPADE